MADKDDVIRMEGEEEPLPLEGPGAKAGDVKVSSQSSSKIQAFGAATAAARRGQVQYKRALNVTGAGATRCRVFNSKITVAAIDHMVNTVNEWLDNNPIEIKCVNQVVGTMEGKVPEPNIIVMVWY